MVDLFADVLPRILRRTFICSFAVGVGLLAIAPFSILGKDTGNVIRIGYQKSGAFLLLKNDGALEKKFAALGFKVEWNEFPSGPPLLEALNAGSIAVGHSGDAPLIFAQVAGIPFKYIGTTSPAEASAGIVVGKNSPIKTLQELKGKRLAFAKGSSSHYLVAKALAEAGLTFEDIRPVYLQPAEARAAFQSGSVDAWAIWDPFFAAAEIDANARVLRSGQGLSPHREYYFARKDFLEAHPEVVAPLLAVLREIGEKAIKDPDGTASFLAAKLGISVAVMEKSERRKQRYYAEPLDSAAISDQQAVADTFFHLGLINKPLNIADAVFRPGP